MKKYIFLYFIFLILFSCKNIKSSEVNNGIDNQILQIVDSLHFCSDVHFVTVLFSSDTLKNPIIRFFSDAIMPVPLMPLEPYREILISEMEDFIGYKKYNDRYIIFIQHSFNNKFDKFVVLDSLKSDEEPFKKYNVYEWQPEKYKNCRGIEQIYRIAENDSLVLLNRENDNVYR